MKPLALAILTLCTLPAQDPFALAKFIDTTPNFHWDDIAKSLGTEPFQLQECQPNRCSTELILIHSPEQVILLTFVEDSQTELYLRFLRDSTQNWRLNGAQQAYIRNYPRRHAIDRNDGKPILKISSQGYTGSDISSEIETWFDLSRSDFEPLFAYSPQAHESRPLGIGREMTTHAFFSGTEISTSSHIRFNANWGLPLGLLTINTTYTLSTNGKEFNYLSGTLPEPELEAMEDLDDGPANATLMKYCMPALRDIATGNNTDSKEWLQQVLANSQSTPEVRELKALLLKRQ